MSRSTNPLVIGAMVLLLLVPPLSAEAQGGPDAKPERARRLIEFGWDEPDTTYLRTHIDLLERSAFDGCVFHAVTRGPDGKIGNPTWESWGTRRFEEHEFSGPIQDLKSFQAQKFRHNFLRLNVTPAKIDWFDDHSAVIQNARLAAKVARSGNCRGILFDTEQYEGKLFQYSNRPQAKTRSWDEYAAQARRRGREVMEAFQDGFPNLTVLLTFGHSLPWDERHRKGTRPLEECENGLLAPFLDGMVEAARDGSRIVDGYEQSYGYRTRDRFEKARQTLNVDLLSMVKDPRKHREFVRAGFGLWLDYDWSKKGWNAVDPSQNYFTPEGFEASVKLALEHSDEFVWIYTETPRWWTRDGKPLKLPAAYDAALRRAK